MEGELKLVEVAEEGRGPPGEVNADERDIPQPGQAVLEDGHRWLVGSEDEVSSAAEGFKMVELEGLEVGCGATAGETGAGACLADVVPDFEKERAPALDVRGDDVEDGVELPSAEGDARDVLGGGDGVDEDVEELLRCGAAGEVGAGAGKVGRLAEADGGPEGGGGEGDAAPAGGDVGDVELEAGRGRDVAVVDGAEEERRVGDVEGGAEDENSGDELDGEAVDGRVMAVGGEHGRAGRKIERKKKKIFYIIGLFVCGPSSVQWLCTALHSRSRPVQAVQRREQHRV